MLYSQVKEALSEIKEVQSKFGSYISATETDRVVIIKVLNYLFKTNRIPSGTTYLFEGLSAKVLAGPRGEREPLATVQAAKTQKGYFLLLQFVGFEPTVEYINEDVFHSVLNAI